jgi:tRNA(Ile)-lysidine synthase
MDLFAHVAGFFDAQGLAGSAGVVAVSGGPDSVALAHALSRLIGPPRLVFAHVNHGLRGAESDADERFVAGLPAQWHPDASLRLPCRVLHVDTATEAAQRGQNLEATAREQRYAWLAEAARQEGAAWVAVAHTADDQAETVLFRLLRGSGVDGLRGMSARRPLDANVALVRPLLEIRRQDVLDYLQAQSLPCRQDSSNLDTAFTRNRLRRELIPQLEREYNPAVVAALCRLARQAEEVQAEMRPLAEELLARAELPRAGDMLVFRADVLAAAPPHRVREAFRAVWKREGWPESAMGFDEWQRLVELARGEVTAWDMAGGVHARNTGRVVQLSIHASGVHQRPEDAEPSGL